jgi:phosphinothricin acetyltransferase
MAADAIRMATAADAAAVRAIYAPVVLTSAITFEYDVPTAEEVAARVRTVTERWPWLVLERDGDVVGYAYATTWRARAAYQWAVETTVYVRDDRHRRGVGRALYRSLLACLRLQGFRLAIGGITLPNPASVALHEAMGFRPAGVHRACGYKLGAWHDVGFWELALAADDGAAPSAPLAPSMLEGTSAWDAALAASVSSARR